MTTRTQLISRGMTHDEAEDHLSAEAGDRIQRQKDDAAEAHFAKKPGHTPGPWDANERGLITHGKNGLHIAQVAMVALSMSSANARLIASAPDLLDALRGMLALDAEHHQRGNDDDVCAEVRAARAAINKATGA